MAITADPSATGKNNIVGGTVERDWRWGRVRAFMDERGLDGLVVFGSQERPGAEHWLSNERHGIAVVFPRNGAATLYAGMGPAPNYAGAILTSEERGEDAWITDVRFSTGGETLLGIVHEKGLDTKKLGTVGTGFAGELQPGGWVGYGQWTGFQRGLPNAELVDVTWDYIVMMMEKSAWDVEHVRRAAAGGEEACRAMIEACRVGASEATVYSAGMYALHSRGIRASWMILQSGHDNIGWVQPAWLVRDQEPRRLEDGDILEAELFPHCASMEAQCQLCVAIGKLSPDHEKCATVARNAYEAGLRALKPGITFGELCEAMEQPVSELGGWHMTPMVHSLNPLAAVSTHAMGIEEHVPAIARRFPKLRGHEITRPDLVIRSGMAFAFEPNAHVGRTRINVGGTIVVTETGCEELNHICNRLIRVPA
jgi:Xaa-Pro aminopeptidase